MKIEQRKSDVLQHDIEEGQVIWKSPSNIALVKYWGKHGNQLPKNPSLSFTLKQSTSKTSVSYRPRGKQEPDFSLEFFFEGKKNELFATRIKAYVVKLSGQLPFLKKLHLEIRSENTFPHSAGIASSASAFSALALGICSIAREHFPGSVPDKEFLQRASALARLGSGSACRSVYPYAALWGSTTLLDQSSDEFAIPMISHLHPIFRTYQDAILIISEEVKQVSSSVGHQLMEGHPFAETRYGEANKNLRQLVASLESGDEEKLGFICEMEAMQLHALMLCSDPNYMLLQPNTVRAIQRIREFRKEESLPVYFTLDAGPNVHLLYPADSKQKVLNFINEQLIELCDEEKWIDDQIGAGPIEIKGIQNE